MSVGALAVISGHIHVTLPTTLQGKYDNCCYGEAALNHLRIPCDRNRRGHGEATRLLGPSVRSSCGEEEINYVCGVCGAEDPQSNSVCDTFTTARMKVFR